jgi:hypothetical protein
MRGCVDAWMRKDGGVSVGRMRCGRTMDMLCFVEGVTDD